MKRLALAALVACTAWAMPATAEPIHVYGQGVLTDYIVYAYTNPVTHTIATATAVPESSTWAMMVVGIGAIGGVLRRAATRPRSRTARCSGELLVSRPA